MLKRGSGAGSWVAVLVTVAALVLAAIVVWRAAQGPGAGPARSRLAALRGARTVLHAEPDDPLEGADVSAEERRHLQEILRDRDAGRGE